MDIISAIDQATGCQQCGNPLEHSVSDDFCGEGCQQAWHASRVMPSGFLLPGEVCEQVRVVDDLRLVSVGPVAHALSSAEQLQYETTVDQMVHTVARAYGVPPELLVSNSSTVLRELRERSNMDVQGWIPLEVWDYLRQGEGS